MIHQLLHQHTNIIVGPVNEELLMLHRDYQEGKVNYYCIATYLAACKLPTNYSLIVVLYSQAKKEKKIQKETCQNLNEENGKKNKRFEETLLTSIKSA